MKLNKKGIALVRRFEGCYLKAYKCPAGVWTIGYGHTNGVKEYDTLASIAEAKEILNQDLNSVASRISKIVPDNINENQFSALVSFAFNCGVAALKASTALKRLHAGDIDGAAEALTWWNKATVNGKKVVLAGLTRRREAEKELFLTPVGAANDLLGEVKELLYNASKKLDQYIKGVEG